MPFASPPRTRLSRVAPHEACLATSTSGMPYLANIPFSLATNSGAASVNAMKPSVAFFTSGPAACAMYEPNGNSALNAPIRAAVPTLAFINDLRLISPPAEFFPLALLLILGVPFRFGLGRVCSRRFKSCANGEQLRGRTKRLAPSHRRLISQHG